MLIFNYFSTLFRINVIIIEIELAEKKNHEMYILIIDFNANRGGSDSVFSYFDDFEVL